MRCFVACCALIFFLSAALIAAIDGWPPATAHARVLRPCGARAAGPFSAESAVGGGRSGRHADARARVGEATAPEARAEGAAREGPTPQAAPAAAGPRYK